MLNLIAKKVFGTKNDRELKRLSPIAEKVHSFEPKVRGLSDEALRAQTQKFRRQHENGKSLDELLPEAFATVREASIRVLGMRHFDVQIIGGIALHEGKIAEMKTGEGKTLGATLAVYLNALSGEGVHVITVNDYLASRDAEWMGNVYQFLGLTTGVIVHGLNDAERRKAYFADVTYGTNNEFGFDYLRDNMKFHQSQFSQRNLNYAIVDEVDSILIDEARTPLIISGPTEDSTDKYFIVDRVVKQLRPEHYEKDEKARSVSLTEEGISRVESLMNIENLYDPRVMEIVHHVNQGLKAHTLFERDKDYVVNEGQVMIVDEFTGRLMPGRRYSDGLHQALEAKEGVKIENENQTLATITFQNYFRMYNKLAGMTGTADTEAEEFSKIYNLEVLVVPTNKPLVRIDYDDLIYKNEKAKFDAVVNDIKDHYELGLPCLVGTVSIAKSELLSEHLKKSGIAHHVLNAKHHEKEAEIIKDAGQAGAVTIATNMAGRGTDIVLGEGVAKKGGLHIIGTERHESRRIDNQLRGRSGRQGDKGSSRFFLSLDDDLMRIFASERLAGYMDKLGFEEDVPIEHKWISKSIEGAQRRVEGRNFDIRKQLLKYDDVMNHQRKIIYGIRKEILENENIHDRIIEDLHDLIEDMVEISCPQGFTKEQWDVEQIKQSFVRIFGLQLNEEVEMQVDARASRKEIYQALAKFAEIGLQDKQVEIPKELFYGLEREIKLRTVDMLWKDHLLSMDHLKEEVGFQGYAQKDPLLVYQKQAFEMLTELVFRIKEEAVFRIFHVQLAPEQEIHQTEDVDTVLGKRKEQKLNLGTGRQTAKKQETVKRDSVKVGRNDPCPCGSGKKYKKCHGAIR